MKRSPQSRSLLPAGSQRLVIAEQGARYRYGERSGQAMLEFAFVLFIMLFLLGGALALGSFFYSASTIQTAVDAAAQEIARTPFAPELPLGLGLLSIPAEDTAADDPRFLLRIYDPQHLVIHQSELGGQSLLEFSRNLPLLNRLLITVMIFDSTYDPDNDGGVYRYPGAIVTDGQTGEETVLIPLLVYSDSGAEAVVRWVAPVEEVLPDRDDPGSSVFPITAEGLVAIRINYPAQAAGLINRTQDNAIIEADDSSLGDPGVGDRYTLVVADNETGPLPQSVSHGLAHSGRYGLGRTAVNPTQLEALSVRPFRRVLSAQAVYRREIFE